MTTLILTATARAVTPFIWVLSVYLLLRGHGAVGGGFIAALVGSAAVVIRSFALGPDGAGFPSRRPAVLVGLGILVAVGFGLAGLALGSSFLSGAVWRGDLPLVGEVKVAASIVFDLGVYLTVLGAIAAVVRIFGEEAR